MQTLSCRSIIRDILKLSAPIALMSMVGFIASAGGIYMLSHLGALEVAALATATVMANGTMIGTTLMSLGIRTGFYRG